MIMIVVGIYPGLAALSAISGLFLAVHFVLWFESRNHTSVAKVGVFITGEINK